MTGLHAMDVSLNNQASWFLVLDWDGLHENFGTHQNLPRNHAHWFFWEAWPVMEHPSQKAHPIFHRHWSFPPPQHPQITMAHQCRYWNTPGLHVQAGSQAANMHSLAMRIAGTTSGLHRRSGPSSTKRLPWRAAPNESRALSRIKTLLKQRLAPGFTWGAYIFPASTSGEKDKPNP